MPETNPYLKAAMLEAVEEQMKELPEAKATFERLVSEGHSEREAKELIGAVLAWELFNVMKEQHPFQHKGYVRALNALPSLPLGSMRFLEVQGCNSGRTNRIQRTETARSLRSLRCSGR